MILSHYDARPRATATTQRVEERHRAEARRTQTQTAVRRNSIMHTYIITSHTAVYAVHNDRKSRCTLSAAAVCTHSRERRVAYSAAAVYDGDIHRVTESGSERQQDREAIVAGFPGSEYTMFREPLPLPQQPRLPSLPITFHN